MIDNEYDHMDRLTLLAHVKAYAHAIHDVVNKCQELQLKLDRLTLQKKRNDDRINHVIRFKSNKKAEK